MQNIAKSGKTVCWIILILINNFRRNIILKNIFKCMGFALILCVLALSAACSKKEPKSYDFKATDLADTIVAGMKFEDDLAQVDRDSVVSKYETEDLNIDNSSVYMSTTATSEEIAVFVAIDETQAQAILDKCTERVEDQRTVYSSYAPQEVTRLDDSYIERKKNVVVLCVVSDSDAAKKVVDDFFDKL